MKTFEYKIKDNLGIHARPAGLLVKFVSKYKSEVIIELGEKSANARKLFGVMGLGAKCGDIIKFNVKGKDEEKAKTEIEKFCNDNF